MLWARGRRTERWERVVTSRLIGAKLEFNGWRAGQGRVAGRDGLGVRQEILCHGKVEHSRSKVVSWGLFFVARTLVVSDSFGAAGCHERRGLLAHWSWRVLEPARRFQC